MASDTAQYDGMDVEILDRESHRGNEVVQIQAVEDGVTLSDQSGEAPWVPRDSVEESEEGRSTESSGVKAEEVTDE